MLGEFIELLWLFVKCCVFVVVLVTFIGFCILCCWGLVSSTRFFVDRFMGKVTHWMPLPEPPQMKGGAE